MAKQSHTLIVTFTDKDAMLEFVANNFGTDVSAYHADALDKETGGRVSPNTYVLRRYGQKPDGFLATRPRIGAPAN